MKRTLETEPYWQTVCIHCGHTRYNHDTHEKKCWTSNSQNNRCECPGFLARKTPRKAKTDSRKSDVLHIVNKPLSPSTKMHPWKNNHLQFARLIAELEMAGAFVKKGLMADLRDSMDLTDAEICEIVERASKFWDEAKLAICPPGRVP